MCTVQNLSKKKALCVKDFVPKKKKDKNASMCNLIFVLPNEDVTFKQLQIQMQRAAGHLKYMTWEQKLLVDIISLHAIIFIYTIRKKIICLCLPNRHLIQKTCILFVYVFFSRSLQALIKSAILYYSNLIWVDCLRSKITVVD